MPAYSIKIHYLEHLQERIIATITPNMLSQVWTENEYCLYVYCTINSIYKKSIKND
jgi:hypothetical protein